MSNIMIKKIGIAELEAGAEAYNAGDYATAIQHYQKAADAGNVTALSNLGYCYYYGRSIPVDKEMARTCWEKAAVLGDICAIYKLGDMYRNGDLPQDIVFSKALYKKAFVSAVKARDLYSYPDACLRILKYCKDDCKPDVYAMIAKDAVNGFKARMEEGDCFSDKLYREALKILDSVAEK